VPTNPALDEFRRQIEALRTHRLLKPHVNRGEIHLGALSTKDIAELLSEEAAYYFLIAAAGFNRTSLKLAMSDDATKIVPKESRKAHAVRERLPVRRSFADIASSAVALRRGDLDRRKRGSIEQLFRDRLAAEGIPILMSPPIRQVPGILIGKRKPDGVYPDPALNVAPVVYLEIKNVRRVADDIQKRLYEIAEASLEMKLIYGSLEIRGLGVTDTKTVIDSASELRARLREQIRSSPPIVVVLFLCSAAEAEKYRQGAEAFVDRVFFQEEIEACLAFLKESIRRHGEPPIAPGRPVDTTRP
jgi:hypothetical protein